MPNVQIPNGRRMTLAMGIAMLVLGLPTDHLNAGKSIGVQIKLDGPTVTPNKGKGPPAHAPAHGYRRKFCYRYYPMAEVYHDSERGIWFYSDGTTWRTGVKLPVDLGRNLGGHVSIELESDHPAGEHARIRETHRPNPESASETRPETSDHDPNPS
jgi:hypothetical protein